MLYRHFQLPWWLHGKESACHAGDVGSIPGSGRSPGGGHNNPLQYSCLENPMDRGAWRHACMNFHLLLLYHCSRARVQAVDTPCITVHGPVFRLWTPPVSLFTGPCSACGHPVVLFTGPCSGCGHPLYHCSQAHVQAVDTPVVLFTGPCSGCGHPLYHCSQARVQAVDTPCSAVHRPVFRLRTPPVALLHFLISLCFLL